MVTLMTTSIILSLLISQRGVCLNIIIVHLHMTLQNLHCQPGLYADSRRVMREI